MRAPAARHATKSTLLLQYLQRVIDSDQILSEFVRQRSAEALGHFVMLGQHFVSKLIGGVPGVRAEVLVQREVAQGGHRPWEPQEGASFEYAMVGLRCTSGSGTRVSSFDTHDG